MDTPYDNLSVEKKSNTLREKFISTLLFILPLAIVYEIGITMGGLDNSINGADAIFRFIWYFLSNILGTTISSIFFGLVIITLIILVVYEIITKRKKIEYKKIGLMYLESLGFGAFIAIFLFIGLNWQLPSFFTFEPSSSVAQQAIAGGLLTPWSKIVASIGAGIFEELLFRVLLLNIIFMTLASKIKTPALEDDMSLFIKAAVFSSLIFAMLHIGTVTALSGLFFIFLVSLILSFIYLKRGYAVAAGTHIVFDLLLLFGIIAA